MTLTEPPTSDCLAGLIEVYFPSCRKRVEEEIRIVHSKREGLQKFRDGLGKIEPRHSSQESNSVNTPVYANDRGGDGVEPILDLYKSHMSSYYETDFSDSDSVIETMANEFNKNLVYQLGDTNSIITPQLKQALLKETAKSINSLSSTKTALINEKDSIEIIGGEIREIANWLQENKQNNLSDLKYEALMNKHEKVQEFINKLDALSEDRQQHIRGSTKYRSFEIKHSNLNQVLYSDYPIDYPVLRDMATSAGELYQSRDQIASLISTRY